MGSLSTLLVGNLEFSDSGNYSCIATDRQSGQSGEKTGILTVKGTFHFLGEFYKYVEHCWLIKLLYFHFWPEERGYVAVLASFIIKLAGSSLLAS